MNRSILIVICDFLLLSLLTFSTDINHIADENTRPPSQVAISTNSPVGSGADLAATMRQALEEERRSREELQQQYTQTRTAATQTQAQLAQREQENARLQEEYASARTNLETLGRQLQTTTTQAQLTQEQLAAKQTEARREAELAAALRQQLDSLSQSNQMTLSEKQRLASQLALAEGKARSAAERADLLLQEEQAARAENARLAEGFKMLATNSSQLRQEIHANQPLAPNAIFSDVVSNRIGAQIVAMRTGIFGRHIESEKTSETVLVTDGKNYFVLCHDHETPVEVWDPGTDWDRLTGSLTGRVGNVRIRSMSFDNQDPRVVFIPVSQAEALQLGSKIYHLSSDPYKFQDAVLVGAGEDYYGECNFQIELNTPQYVRLDRSVIRGLFGKFNPSRGDLVFSRSDELLGIMVNNTYCLTIHNFSAVMTFPFDTDLRKRPTGTALSDLGDSIMALPANLQ